MYFRTTYRENDDVLDVKDFKDTAVGFQLRIRQSKVDITRVRGGIRGFC